MTTNIIINLSVEGFHNWEDAKYIQPEVAFLSYKHRHTFNICCKKNVTHSDRDIEIILFKREIISFLYDEYGIQSGPDEHYKWCDFGPMSCEMIAEVLLNRFELEYCSVMEDNENGAECIK